MSNWIPSFPIPIRRIFPQQMLHKKIIAPPNAVRAARSVSRAGHENEIKVLVSL
jgi:hypothetical protein